MMRIKSYFSTGSVGMQFAKLSTFFNNMGCNVEKYVFSEISKILEPIYVSGKLNVSPMQVFKGIVLLFYKKLQN